MKKAGIPQTIDEYIDGYPEKIRKILQKIRKTIQKAAPGVEESISYQIPAFKLNGVLVYVAAHQNHIGLYPAPRGAQEFKKELEQYEGGKGTVQFPLDEPVPYELITRIVKYKVKENTEKKPAGKKKRVTAVAAKKR